MASPSSAGAVATPVAPPATSPATPPAAAPQPARLEPLSGAARNWGTLALSAAVFMNVLDSSIANVSLPAIAGDLGVSTNQGTWVITSFAVANAIAVPLTGWLSQRFGQVRLFVASVALFVLASWLCGLAPNMTMLIAFRVLQGFVAGPMIPLSQALLLSSYPRALAGLAMAMWSMTTLVAPVTGPLLGGWITDNMTWPWIFYINVPIGIASALATWAIFKNRETATRKLPIDAIGLSLLVIWVAAMQIMLDIGKEHDWFASPVVVACAAVAVVGFIYFLVWELGEAHPVVDLSLFKVRNFWAGTLAISVGYGLFFGNVVLMPLWLQQYMGYTATSAGMAMAPVGLLAIVLSPMVGKTIQRVDPRWYATFAFLVFALVLWMRSHFSTQVNFGIIMVPTLIQGVGMAFFFIPLITLTMGKLPPERVPAASGLSNFLRITAGAVGTSVATTLWERRATLHHARLVEQLGSGDGVAGQFLHGMQAAGMGAQQALMQMERMVNQQAYMLAANDVFLGSALLFLLLVPLVWLANAPARGTAGADAGAGAH
ncbi:DHA2 family multidrug resistance protein [Corticibacter populi]|nr:DHA2 family efflux MFS transporter permease subunit [Corticibacter populi]RZS32947.1 DHA2 family multidrug resistance protein [Corticibacter populi]